MKENRFSLPNPWTVDKAKTGDPFLSQQQVERNLANQRRIEAERNKVSMTRQEVRRIK